MAARYPAMGGMFTDGGSLHREIAMEIRIGIVDSPSELSIELEEDSDGDAVRADIDASFAEGGPLWLVDRYRRRVAVPTDNIAYVEISEPHVH